MSQSSVCTSVSWFFGNDCTYTCGLCTWVTEDRQVDAWSKDVVMKQESLLSLTSKLSLWGPQPRMKMPEGLRSSLSSQVMRAMVVMVA